MLDQARAEIQHGPVLAQRQARLQHLQDRHDRMMAIVCARAAETPGVPGAISGLLDGADRRLDRSLLSELRESTKNRWPSKWGSGNEGAVSNFAIQIVLPTLSASVEPQPEAIFIALPRR